MRHNTHIPTSLLMVLLGLIVSASVSAETLIMGDLGGSYAACQKKTLIEPWEAKTGNKIVFGSAPYDTGQWKLQHAAGGVEWDITTVDASQLAELIHLGLLAPLGPKIAQVKLIDFPHVRVGNKAIASELFANVISWRTDKFARGPTSWKDVFNLKKFPGKRMFSRNATDYGVLEIALLADGVDPSHLYPLNVKRALHKLDTIRKSIVWYQSGAEMINAIQQGNAWLGAGYDGRLTSIIAKGQPVAFTYQHALIRPDYWAIPADSHKKQLARQFIDFAMQPKQQAHWAECSHYTPVAQGAFKLLPKTFTLSVNPDHPTDGVTVVDYSFWKNHRKSISKQFQEWLLTK